MIKELNIVITNQEAHIKSQQQLLDRLLHEASPGTINMCSLKENIFTVLEG